MNKRRLGKQGEALAEKYFIGLGYHVEGKNYFSTFGEVDLILKKDGQYFFVEVKYRRTCSYGLPREAITSQKKKRLYQTAITYMKSKALTENFRIIFLGIREIDGHIEYDLIDNIWD